MSEHLTEIDCQLGDCLYFRTDEDRPGAVFCAHADRARNPQTQPCPLYRLDWQRKMALTASLLHSVRKR